MENLLLNFKPPEQVDPTRIWNEMNVIANFTIQYKQFDFIS